MTQGGLVQKSENEQEQTATDSSTAVSPSSSASSQTSPSQTVKVSKPSRRDKKAASAFRTISEVADILGVQQHVLRFWETKFSQVKPLKRGGGRRYYRPEDVVLLERIRDLLYNQGYTIKGVQKLLKDHGKNKVVHGVEQSKVSAPTGVKTFKGHDLSPQQKETLELMLGELKELRRLVSNNSS